MLEDKSHQRITYHSNLHSHTDTSFYRSTDVVTVPGRDLRNIWEYSYEDKETSEVLDSVVLHTDKNDEADDPVARSALELHCSATASIVL
jgi:hypothetical protein